MLSIFYVLGDTYANISIYAKITGSMEKKKKYKKYKAYNFTQKCTIESTITASISLIGLHFDNNIRLLIMYILILINIRSSKEQK